MPISIKSLAALGYAPLVVDGKSQTIPATVQSALTFSGAGAPGGALTPVLLCNQYGWQGQLSVQLSNPDGFPGNENGALQLTATYTLPSGAQGAFNGLWYPPPGTGPTSSKVTEITVVLVADATLLGATTYQLLGPLSFVFTVSGAAPQQVGTQVVEVYCGPMPAGGPGDATDVFQLRRWVARDLPSQQVTAADAFAACALAAFAAPPSYASANHYWTTANNFDLTDWLYALRKIQPRPQTANCYDSTAMSCVLLALQTLIGPVNFWAGDISSFAWLQQSVPTRGGGASALAYGDHMVTLVDMGFGAVVLDATFGPHTGTETPAQYLANMLKPVDPPREPGDWASPPTGPASPRPAGVGAEYLPLTVDGEPFVLGSATLPQPQRVALNRRALGALTGMPRPSTPVGATGASPPEAMVGAPASPERSPALPDAVMLVHQRSVHEHPVSRRHWTFESSEGVLRVDAWVSADGAVSAQERFLDEGAGSSSEAGWRLGEPLGDACVVREIDGARELLCVSGGLVLRVAAEGPGADLAALARDLLDAAQRGAARPVLRALTPSRPTVAVGNVVRLDIDGDAHLPVRLLGAEPHLRIVGGDERGLTLRAVAPARAELVAVVVDPDTLLSARATATMIVVATG